MATRSHSARPWVFKLTGALVIAACGVAVPTIILASQPARPAAPFGVHLTEAEFTAAKRKRGEHRGRARWIAKNAPLLLKRQTLRQIQHLAWMQVTRIGRNGHEAAIGTDADGSVHDEFLVVRLGARALGGAGGVRG